MKRNKNIGFLDIAIAVEGFGEEDLGLGVILFVILSEVILPTQVRIAQDIAAKGITAVARPAIKVIAPCRILHERIRAKKIGIGHVSALLKLAAICPEKKEKG